MLEPVCASSSKGQCLMLQHTNTLCNVDLIIRYPYTFGHIENIRSCELECDKIKQTGFY